MLCYLKNLDSSLLYLWLQLQCLLQCSFVSITAIVAMSGNPGQDLHEHKPSFGITNLWFTKGTQWKGHAEHSSPVSALFELFSHTILPCLVYLVPSGFFFKLRILEWKFNIHSNLTWLKGLHHQLTTDEFSSL